MALVPDSPLDTGVTQVIRVADTRLPTRHGTFRMTAYRDNLGEEHVVLSAGIHDGQRSAGPPLVRVHSECLTGDALGSFRCDCGEQLDLALEHVARLGLGAVVYVRGHEGRGIGLAEKLRAYELQDAGIDTVEANLRLGHLADARRYEQAALMLADLGVHQLRLLSSNPAKEQALRGLGVDVVGRERLVVPSRPENRRYLRTKVVRMGHDRRGPDAWSQLLSGVVPERGELAERYGALVSPDGPRVIAQLGQSLDGFIATRTGHAEFVTGEQDREHLHRLRALVDAVVVGAATVVADDCLLTVRAVTGPHPIRVVLDPRGIVPPTSALFQDGAAATMWLVGPEVPDLETGALGGHVQVIRAGRPGPMDPTWVLDTLHRYGVRRILVEGGGRLVSAWVDAGVVDRLFLTTAPVLIGDGVPGLRVRPHDTMDQALRAPARRWQLGDDVVTELDLSARREAQPEDG